MAMRMTMKSSRSPPPRAMTAAVMRANATSNWKTRAGLPACAGSASRGGTAAGTSFSVTVIAGITLPAAVSCSSSVERLPGPGPGFGVGRQHRFHLVDLLVGPLLQRLGDHLGDRRPPEPPVEEGLDGHLVGRVEPGRGGSTLPPGLVGQVHAAEDS